LFVWVGRWWKLTQGLSSNLTRETRTEQHWTGDDAKQQEDRGGGNVGVDFVVFTNSREGRQNRTVHNQDIHSSIRSPADELRILPRPIVKCQIQIGLPALNWVVGLHEIRRLGLWESIEQIIS
jgi:hypothetical protein